MLGFLEKKSRSLPAEELLRRAEKLARKTLSRGPSAGEVAALLDLTPVLRTWGRRETAVAIEDAARAAPQSAGTADAAREIGAAAAELRGFAERIRAAFDRDSTNEEHFPATIDPRIYHVKLLLDFFGPLDGRRVLDVGCGKGRFARVLKERYPQAEIWGLDISPAMLDHVPDGIRVQQGLMTDLPFPDAYFDDVYATESLEHAVAIDAAVGEMCRVARPGGRLAIIDKNAEKWGQLATPEWEKWFGRREIERLLARHCREVSSEFISYWEDVAPDGLFIAWKAVR